MSKEVIVIGGGVIGLCSAYYLLKSGCKVTVVERESQPNAGCSIGNAGMIVPSHFIPLASPGKLQLGLKMISNPKSPFAIKPALNKDLIQWGYEFARHCTSDNVEAGAPILRDMNLLSRSLYLQLADDIGDFGLVTRGLTMFCKTNEALKEEVEVAEIAHSLGMSAVVMDPDELQHLDPKLTLNVVGGVYFPEDCHLSPGRFIQNLAQSIVSMGGHIVYDQEIIGWQTKDSQVGCARTSNHTYEADEFVVATGAWSPENVKALDIQLLMQSGKGYSFNIQDPVELPEICSILVEARIAVTPMAPSLRFAGTMEITGNDLSINRNRVAGILESIPEYFPKFDFQGYDEGPIWSGLRPCSPDGLPYLGRPHRYSNLTVATGHSMMGISLGPATGLLVSQLVSKGPTSLNISALNIERFH